MSVAQAAASQLLSGGARSDARSSSGGNVVTFGEDVKSANYTNWLIIGGAFLVVLFVIKKKA